MQNRREVHELFSFPLEIGATKTLMCSYMRESPMSVSHSWQECLNWPCSHSHRNLTAPFTLQYKPLSSRLFCSVFLFFRLFRFFGFTSPGGKKNKTRALPSYLWLRPLLSSLVFTEHVATEAQPNCVEEEVVTKFRFSAPSVEMIGVYNNNNGNCKQINNDSHSTAHGARNKVRNRTNSW